MALKQTTEGPTGYGHHALSMSRPSSAPVIPGPKSTVPLAAVAGATSQAAPLLSRTLSSIGRLGLEPSLLAQEPQSYRNAIMGIKASPGTGAGAAGFTPRPTQSTISSQGLPSSSSSTSSAHPPRIAARKDDASMNPCFSFGPGRPDSLHNLHQWAAQPPFHLRDSMQSGSSSLQSQCAMPEEFPHLDIINDLLDEDRIVGRAVFNEYQHHRDFHHMNQQYVCPGDLVTADVDPLNSACHFDLPDYYYDELSQMVYDSFMPFQGFGDLQPLQLDFGYGNSMDALFQNQWPVGGADLSLLNFGSALDGNGYAYQFPEYSGCDVGGYNMMYQPANGI